MLRRSSGRKQALVSLVSLVDSVGTDAGALLAALPSVPPAPHRGSYAIGYERALGCARRVCQDALARSGATLARSLLFCAGSLRRAQLEARAGRERTVDVLNTRKWPYAGVHFRVAIKKPS